MEQKLRRDCNMGSNLRKLRLEHNLSQEKLCAELQRNGCDIGRSTYEKYELSACVFRRNKDNICNRNPQGNILRICCIFVLFVSLQNLLTVPSFLG